MASRPPVQPVQRPGGPRKPPSRGKKRRKSSSGKLSPRTLRMMAIAWIGIVAIVGACTFLGIIWAFANTSGGQQVAGNGGTLPDQPTPVADAQDADSEGGQPSNPAVPTVPPLQDDSFGYGIQAQLHLDTERTLDQIEQLGLNWVKQQIRWKDLEPNQGQANWDALSGIFGATSERDDLKVLVSVVAAPDWARTVTAPELEGPPDDPEDFANYVAEMVQRFPGSIHAIEVWNEQNIEREWYTAGGINAEAYVELLAATEEAVHAVDPNVIVISGALAPTGVNNAQARDDIAFMREMIDAGILDYADCVGAHANGINLPPDIAYDEGYDDPAAEFRGPFDNPHPSWSFYSTLNSYHDLVVAAGQDTPLCVTEFGWATVEGMDGEPRDIFGFAYDNTLEEQADNIVNAFGLMHDWGFVKLAFLFNLDYSPKAGGNPQDDSTLFSVTAPTGAPRPSFEAIRDMPKPP